MATHLDLEEQEQLDQLKHFWKSWGNLITWVLIAVLGAYAAWNAYHYWQRSQAAQAAALYEEVERSAQAGDLARLERSLADMKDKFGGTSQAQQAALLAARVFQDKDKADAAKAALVWVAEKSSDTGYQALARLRLAAVLIQEKAYEPALKQLGGEFPKDFSALAADRQGDVLVLLGKKAEAAVAYGKAYSQLDEQTDYRRLVEAKLNALGIDPRPKAPESAENTK